jgi:outer membrane protein assembly factor BamD
MILRLLTIFIITIFLNSCSKQNNKEIYAPKQKVNSYNLYKEAMQAFNENNFFYASKKFSEAELNFLDVKLAAKASLMSAYSFYSINFYDEALENLNRFLKIYPADKNVIYAHYLIAIIHFEQITDEAKDIGPLINANEKVNFFLKNYPKTDYAIDLKFKQELIQNQLAAKEMYVAKYYISVKKWVPAINRLKIIVEKYFDTIFIEEALHRLIEIHYHIGLEKEAQKYASILGYNYNSGEWFKQSYKILNKDYEIKKKTNLREKDKKEHKGIIKKIIKMIK